MERIVDEPTEPGADDFGDDVHDATDYRHAARCHHANCDEWVEAGARECVNRNQNGNEGPAKC